MTMERQQTIERLGSMISTIRIAMLTTLTEDGVFRSRPITTHGALFDGDLWFFTRIDAAKLDQLGQHRRVGVSYASPADNIYVSLSGTARISMDPGKARELWDPSYSAWFPEGPTDPELALIQVVVDLAEYWAAPAHTWPLSAGFVVMSPDRRNDPRFHARIVLRQADLPAI